MQCPYCDRAAKVVTGNVIYPHRIDLRGRLFYLCAPCDAYVGTHRGTKKPLGRLANKSLRGLRGQVHAAFDPLWRSQQMTRTQAYEWLSSAMGISPANCHVGMFDEDQCRAALAVLRKEAA
jgi:hypothetical protein